MPTVVTLAALLSCVQLVVPASARAADVPANPVNKPGYTLDLDEEFDGSSLNTGTWLPSYLPHWSTRALAAPRYSVSGGALHLRLDQDQPAWNPDDDGTVRVSSIQTYEQDYLHQFKGFNGSMQLDHHEPRFNGYTTQYGYFEMRAKGPNTGGGGHTAWWMVGTQDDQDSNGNGAHQTAEIDVTETTLANPNQLSPKLHPWTDTSIRDTAPGATVGGDPANEYHLYAMNWTPDGLQFYYDNQLVSSTDQAPNYPMAMLLSIYTDTSWSGAANDVWPKTWSIDYLRVYKADSGYPTETGPFRIRNRNTGQYMYLEDKTGKVELSSSVPAHYWSGQWYLNSYQGQTYLRNRWTRDFLNNEAKTNAVQYGPVQYKWWSAQWTLQQNGDYTRILNRNSADYLNAQDDLGYVQEGPAPTSWWSADWVLEPVS